MVLKLKYGDSYTQAKLRLKAPLVELKPRRVTSLQCSADLLSRSLDRSVGSYPARRLFRRARNLLIVLPQNNWRGQAVAALNALLASLRQAHVLDKEVKILLAGRRRVPLNRSQIIQFFGEEIFERYQIFQHDATDQAQLEFVGETHSGTPIFLNKHILDADEIILCSPIAPHPLLGYSGGPSVIVPDCAGEVTIARLYDQALDAKGKVHKRCTDCSTEGNPIQESIRESLRFISARFGFYVVFNHNNGLVSAFSGHPFQAFAAGLEIVDSLSVVDIERQADATIVSPGGAPHDNRFIDAVPALLRALRSTRPGGAVFLSAACQQGFGYNGFRNSTSSNGSFLNESPNQLSGIEEKLMRTLLAEYSRRNHIFCVSQLPEPLGHLEEIQHYTSLQEALDKGLPQEARPELVYLINDGVFTVPLYSAVNRGIHV